MDRIDSARRTSLGAAALVCLAATGCARPGKEAGDKPVTATEGLMREHGVLRRALLVYQQTATRLLAGDLAFDATAIAQTAALFRSFGEDYHERQLEEAFIFPAVKRKGGAAAQLADVLKAQHDRGREITDYVQRACQGGRVGTGDAAPLAQVLRAMVTMYENHAAREDTVIFPAWKDTLSDHGFKEMGETFEDIERKTFGGDGFDQAAKRIADIEGRLGYADIARFTAPAPRGAVLMG